MPKRRPPSFTRPRRLEAEYERAVSSIIRPIIPEIRVPGLHDNVELFGIPEKRIHLVESAAQRIAKGMVTVVSEGNARSWREAASRSTHGRRIYDALKNELQGAAGVEFQARIAAQARLIADIPRAVSTQVSQGIAERQLKGERADDIARDLRKRMPEITQARIALIARTGVSSTATAVTRVRSTGMGLNWYEWDTSEDARVRPSHRNMDLVLVNWKEPPSPEALIRVRSTLGHYHAGNCPNCRCDTNVVVDLDQLTWPHKVYSAGKITRMTRAQFSRLF